MRALNVGGIGKIAFFDRSRSHRLIRFTAENVCPSVTVACVHDGALAEEYAVSSITLAVVEVCLSHARLTSSLCDMQHRMLPVR